MSSASFRGKDDSRPPFTMIDNRIMDRRDLSPIDRTVYAHYKRWAFDGSEKYWRAAGYKNHPYSIKEMATALCISVGAISQSRKKLAGLGLVALNRVNRTKGEADARHEHRFFFEVVVCNLGSPDEPKSADKVHTVNLLGSPGDSLLNKEKKKDIGANAPRVDATASADTGKRLDPIEHALQRQAIAKHVKLLKAQARPEDGLALEIALAFCEVTHIKPHSPKDAQGQMAAARQMQEAGCTVADMRRAIAKLRDGGMTITDLHSVKKTAGAIAANRIATTSSGRVFAPGSIFDADEREALNVA